MDGGQTLALWGIQRGTVVLPKSVTPSKITSNLQVKVLLKDAFDELNALERHKRFSQAKVQQIAEGFAEENKEKFTLWM
jgi:diketogulonate reductase-like aldo/keto reductase